MAETLLITINDIRDFWPLDPNINNDRLLMHIRRGQQSDLKPFLGDEFYFSFINNLTTVPNKLLFDGGEYDYQGNQIFFSGVRQLMSAYAYARLYVQNPDFVSRGGNVRKETEESTAQLQSVTNVRGQEALSEGIRVQFEIWTFLDQNRDTYPDWNIRAPLDSKNRTSFKLRKLVPRKLLERGAADQDLPPSDFDLRYKGRPFNRFDRF